MFKFSLQPVLSLKEKIEDSKKRDFGKAIQEEEKIKEEKIKLEEEKLEALNSAREQSKDRVNVVYIKAFNHYNTYINQAIETKNEELKVAHQKVEEKRAELLEAMKERKILDNLKEIHLEAYLEEEKHAEQRLTDDIVTYRFRNQTK